ncbi:MAG: phenylacetate--CoA ligase [Candidatus Methanomethylophilaceae archaeon]|jgi:phenylacetate-CoA ligase|nr:phenylacetate--CoA ligase [Candidatus Methanomethylophilaceae archaeon]
MKMTDQQLGVVIGQLSDLKDRSPFYREKFKDTELSTIRTQEDFEKLPFTDKPELRDAYPLGLQAVPDREVVRIHSSSGTTGTPVIIPYTKQDVDDWAIMFERCYRMAGVTEEDRVHITPGYGLWTAGIGFQAGAERLGAMCIPLGPGNTDKQIRMMVDMGSTVLTATSSYALLLAEEITRRGLNGSIRLRKALIGSERWGEKMRRRIAEELGVELYDIYGLTEVYGPGIGISCGCGTGMHYWDDYVYFEIIDRDGNPVPDGEYGELVITTLRKQGAPLIRYRTHDMTRIIPGTCPCGDLHPRIDILVGRTDDMVKVKGVNIYPGQVDEVLRDVEGVSSEYQVMIDHLNGKDIMTLFFETPARDPDALRELEATVRDAFKSKVGVTVVPKAVGIGDLPRSEKKSNRIFDNRY